MQILSPKIFVLVFYPQSTEHISTSIAAEMSDTSLTETTELPSLPLPSGLPRGTSPDMGDVKGAQQEEELPTPAHRSHDPSNNTKRTDPFQFGSRFLTTDDDVFEFNAWDHVMPDDSYYAYAEAQLAQQRASPVSEFDKKNFNANPAKWWNRFYSHNTSNFFKNRKWLQQEFPILTRLTAKDAGPVKILEVGAGAGNTAFPILASNENQELMIHACDFSKKAIDLIRNNEAYDPKRIQASVWDVSDSNLPDDVAEGSVDLVLLIFIFSALHPEQWEAAANNVFRLLKPGGEVCFRDYGRGDLTQLRFKKGRLLEENFYIRGDGTRVYFFSEEELRAIWGNLTARVGELQTATNALSSSEKIPNLPSSAEQTQYNEQPEKDRKSTFDILSLGVDRRMLVNRKRELKMHRCWMQGRFRKPTKESPIDQS